MPKESERSENPEQLGYGAALSELEKLVSEMEQGHIDIDHLERKVARATQLVDYCRLRLSKVASDLEALTAADSPLAQET